MKIHIKSANYSKIKLWLPTTFLKSNLIFRIITKNSNDAIKQLLSYIPTIYKQLIKHIKENGHFVLIDIITKDGDIIYITI